LWVIESLLNVYVRWFNRTRRRDGPLFRGRFRSIPVTGPRYFQAVVRYIDDNPVEARLCSDAVEYEFASKRHHVNDVSRPLWLCSDLIDRTLAQLRSEGLSTAAAYARVYPPRLSRDERQFVDRRVAHPDRCATVLESLERPTPTQVYDWMVRKARLADGTRPGLPLVLPSAVADLVAMHRSRSVGCLLEVGHRALPLWDVAYVALLRSLSGETLESIGRRIGHGRDRVRTIFRAHGRAMAADIGYRGILVELTRRLVVSDDDLHAARLEPPACAG